jgi:3D (Asp-Asp-Asp) domain-containing protein
MLLVSDMCLVQIVSPLAIEWRLKRASLSVVEIIKLTLDQRGQPMLIEAVLIGTMTVTSYRAVPEQTKPECTGRHHCETSVGDNVSEAGVAVSQDLLRSGIVHYGDVLCVDGFGCRVINDCMAARHKRRIDLFVYTKQEERRIGTRHLRVWAIHAPGKDHHVIQKLSK